MRLDREIAFVTGASRGIGRAIALALGRKRVKVAAGYLENSAGAREVVDVINDGGGQSLLVRGDVADENQVDSMATTIEGFLGAVTILVNNAGITHFKKLHETTVEDWDRVVGTNLRGPFLLSKRLAPGMKAAGRGRIINIGSSVGISGVPHGMDYVSAKSGVIGLTKALAKALAPEVTVNCVCPGLTDTDMAKQLERELGPARKEWAINARAMKRIGTPEDVADAVLHLLEDGDFMTGQTLVVDGGRVLL